MTKIVTFEFDWLGKENDRGRKISLEPCSPVFHCLHLNVDPYQVSRKVLRAGPGYSARKYPVDVASFTHMELAWVCSPQFISMWALAVLCAVRGIGTYDFYWGRKRIEEGSPSPLAPQSAPYFYNEQDWPFMIPLSRRLGKDDKSFASWKVQYKEIALEVLWQLFKVKTAIFFGLQIVRAQVSAATIATLNNYMRCSSSRAILFIWTLWGGRGWQGVCFC